MKFENTQLKNIIIASLLLIIGILFCCSLAMGITGLSMIIGFILLVLGFLFITESLLKNKGIMTVNGLLGVVIVTLAILFMVNKIAYIIISFIPWFLIVFGCGIIADTLLGKFVRHDESLTQFILKLVIGGLSIILGILLLSIDEFLEYASLILGIIMIVYAIYIIINIFLKTKSTLK